jgi:hypothetical protein
MTDAISLMDFTYAFADEVTAKALPALASDWLIYDWLHDMRRAAEAEQADDVARLAQAIAERIAYGR